MIAMRCGVRVMLISLERWSRVPACPSFPAGWLRTLADERLAPALRLMHADPARPWQLEELARTATMSRTTFASRFKAMAGVPPLT
jgi:transcriptional regulator GlxA family with amidase domain